MKCFFDTEFTGLHQHTSLISIGLVAENGRTFYAELSDYDHAQIDDWLRDNVIANLYTTTIGEYVDRINTEPGDIPTAPTVKLIGYRRGDIAVYLETWLRSFGEQIEMWSDCLSFDWMLFCQLFGHAFNIPDCVYYIPFDICTLFKMRGIDPDISREEFAGMDYSVKHKHNSLWDAQVIKACYDKLMEANNNGHV